MNWNTKPPSYSKSQSSLLHKWLRNQLSPVTQSSFSSPGSSQEPCMYSSESHPASQPLLNIPNYTTQIFDTNMQNRIPVSPQTSLEQRTYTNVSGPQLPNLNLQKSTGIMHNVWLNLPITNSLPYSEVAVAHQTNLGTKMPNVHTLQGHIVPAESYTAQLQMAPSSSLRSSVSVQGNERMNPSLLDAQQYMSPELAYPDYRPLTKQYSHSTPQAVVQEPSIQKPTSMPSTSLQVQNSLLPVPTQTIQPMETVAITTYQCTAEKRPLPPPYHRHYRIQPLPRAQPVNKQLSSVDVSPNPDVASYGNGKDFCKGLPQQWQSTNENRHTHEKLYNWQENINVKQPFNEPVESVVSMQTFPASNQGRMDSYIPTSGQILNSNDVTKEKIVRDLKSLVEIKKKFSELARKIKINKHLLKAASSKTENTMYTGPPRPSELSARAMPAKSDGNCSMELLATCLSLWQKSPAQATDESASKLSMESQSVVSTTSTAVAVSEPVKEVPGKRLALVEGNSHNKMTSPSQVTALSLVITPSFESPAVNTKGTEPQVAVVSPLILSQDKNLSVRGVALESPSEPVYPIIKEGSICSLQDQLAQNTRIPAVTHVDVSGSGSSGLSRHFSLEKEKQNETGSGNSQDPPNTDVSKLSQIEKEKQNEPGIANSGDPLNADLRKLLSFIEMEKQNEQGIGNSKEQLKADLGKQSPMGDQQTLCKSKHSSFVSCDMLQIGNICSLVEGNVAYDSQIASIFKSSHLKKIEAHEISPSCPQIISCEQQKVHHACEKKNFDSQKEQFVPSSDNLHQITDQSESQEPSPGQNGDANRKAEAKSVDCTTQEGPPQDTCYSSIQPNTSQETLLSGSNIAKDPTIHESFDDSVLYLQDQLSELLKEFPYGIEAMNTHKGFVDQQKTAQVSDNQNGSKMASCPKESTDQIQITILSSEQMKEIFPEEQGQLCVVEKLEEPQKEKSLSQAENQCASAAPMGENSCEDRMNKLEEDKVHCCALGWLSELYEGVPHCQCKDSDNRTKQEDEGKGQCSPSEISTCKEGERAPDEDVTIIECISVSNKSETPLTPKPQKSHLLELLSNGQKDTSRIKKSPQRAAKELTHHISSRCDGDNQKHATKKQYNSVKMRPERTDNSSSKDDKLDPLQGQTRKVKWKFHDSTVDIHGKVISCNRPGLQEKLPKNHTPQASQTAPTLSDPQKTNSSSVQSTAPSQKLKFRAGGSKVKYLEKRKLNPGSTSELERKKKKVDHQEHGHNVESSPKLGNVLSSQNKKASEQEKVESNPVSSKSRVITVQEYLKRQKQKQMMEGKSSKKTCVEGAPSDPQASRSSKCSMQDGGSGKPNEICDSLSKEPLNILPSQDNIKIHHPPKELKRQISRNVKEKVAGKEFDKTCLDKNKSENTLSIRSKEARAIPRTLQVKDRGKNYLNRVAYNCTEGESICLTKLDSLTQKHPKDKLNQEPKPKAPFPEKSSVLEFKLGPDLLLKNTSSAEEHKDLNACPRKEQAPVQGIKSTKEDWLKCGMTRKRMEENHREIDKAKSKICKRSFSADGSETRENPGKDSSKAVFQTYKQMYLEKRSKSLGDSPVK
ncbi:PREDICTED: uncharacterized protein KIAA1551 homolog [Dipodomys ordii]|uniref:Uncharacterized protein KIAA1551 homolog n=1 Tax=Dipodomys ordii TaxID=10020 RepID=A0A1S3GJ22_DIPOR|nr:PREDICTED: uncharacterized protein KIAA1551 homolog [Dipodomys ordii]